MQRRVCDILAATLFRFVSTTVMSSVCALHPVFTFCVLRYVRRQNARHSPKCLEILGAGQENAIGRGCKHTVC